MLMEFLPRKFFFSRVCTQFDSVTKEYPEYREKCLIQNEIQITFTCFFAKSKRGRLVSEIFRWTDEGRFVAHLFRGRHLRCAMPGTILIKHNIKKASRSVGFS